MSGAAEGIAGLALSAVSVAALFTTCIECFDIVVAGKNFSDDYEQLCALFSLQRARFGLWGESVGLVPNPCDGRRLRYNKNIDRPDIRPGIERILNNIKSLLGEASRVNERYGLKADQARDPDVSTSRGIDIFKGSFDRFKSRIRKHQKDTSAWKVTRWAIHDATKFEDMINRLEKFVDGLESITKSLGLLEQQHARLQEEIKDISDMQSLKLLRDASSSHRSSPRDVSDTASRRLARVVTESILEQQTLNSRSVAQGTGTSFVTAPSALDEATKVVPFAQAKIRSLTSANTRSSTQAESSQDVGQFIPGAWPNSIKSDVKVKGLRLPPQIRQGKGIFKIGPSCEGCLEEHYKCVLDLATKSCTRCLQTGKKCSFLVYVVELNANVGNEIVEDEYSQPEPVPVEPARAEWDLPQNQRVLKDLVQKTDPPRPLSFTLGDTNYGKHLEDIKSQDEDHWLNNSTKLLAHAESGSSAAKRMFFELRNIKRSKISFISAVPVDDSLSKVLASIEGPPETPYEGGVFWITVKLPEQDPFDAPLMRFQTKIYHPNISPQGEICADYREKWASLGNGRARSNLSPSSWYGQAAHPRETQWSLGSLLTALCGLLASPVVDDPLVPEIAQMYLIDYEGYCRNAKLYTKRYAMNQRPERKDLIFFEELPEKDAETMSAAWSPISQSDRTNTDSYNLSNIGRKSWINSDADSLQRSLRKQYDEKFPGEEGDAREVGDPEGSETNSVSDTVSIESSSDSLSLWHYRDRRGLSPVSEDHEFRSSAPWTGFISAELHIRNLNVLFGLEYPDLRWNILEPVQRDNYHASGQETDDAPLPWKSLAETVIESYTSAFFESNSDRIWNGDFELRKILLLLRHALTYANLCPWSDTQICNALLLKCNQLLHAENQSQFGLLPQSLRKAWPQIRDSCLVFFATLLDRATAVVTYRPRVPQLHHMKQEHYGQGFIKNGTRMHKYDLSYQMEDQTELHKQDMLYSIRIVTNDGQTWEFPQNFARFEDGRLAIETESTLCQSELPSPPEWTGNPSEMVLPFEMYLNELFLLGKEKLLAIVKTRGLQLLVVPNDHNPEMVPVPWYLSKSIHYTDIYSSLMPSMMDLGTTMIKVTRKGRQNVSLSIEDNYVYWDPLSGFPNKGFPIHYITDIRTGLGLEGIPQSEEELSRSFSITYNKIEYRGQICVRSRRKTKHFIAPNKATRNVWLRVIRTVWEALKRWCIDICKRYADSSLDLSISEALLLYSRDDKIQETGEGLLLATNATDGNVFRRSRRLSI